MDWSLRSNSIAAKPRRYTRASRRYVTCKPWTHESEVPMEGKDALRRLRRALARLQRVPGARLRLVLTHDPPGVDAVELTSISTNHGTVNLHLTVQFPAEPPKWLR